MSEISDILAALNQGDVRAGKDLWPLVYDELRRLAAAKLAKESPGQTLQPTALVHEAYLRLAAGSNAPRWDSAGHFFAAAAEAMRRILVDNARRKKRIKRGGHLQKVEVPDPPADESAVDLVELDQALTQLAAEDEVAARVVEMRRFAGLSHEQVAAALGITNYQARQKWTYARAWLRKALGS
jgi:RNA polymerase sigma factor (TIGR02999 family)